MLVNKNLIEIIIAGRERKNDPIKEFSVRYKTSSINRWCEFEPYTRSTFQKIYNQPVIDGVKMKFRYTTLTINGRHRST